MGTGVRTYLSATTPFALVVGVTMFASFGSCLAAGLGFGVGRAVLPLQRFLSGAPDQWDNSLDKSTRWLPQISSASVLVAVAIFLTR
jgi:hypothetical protein